MLQYVNSFSCIFNEDENSFVIHFKQNEPIVKESDNGEIVETIEKDVVSIIIGEGCAKELCTALSRLSDK